METDLQNTRKLTNAWIQILVLWLTSLAPIIIAYLILSDNYKQIELLGISAAIASIAIFLYVSKWMWIQESADSSAPDSITRVFWVRLIFILAILVLVAATVFILVDAAITEDLQRLKRNLQNGVPILGSYFFISTLIGMIGIPWLISIIFGESLAGIAKVFILSDWVQTRQRRVQTSEFVSLAQNLRQYESVLDNSKSARTSAIIDMRIRGAGLRSLNILLLGIVVVVLVATAVFVVYAGNITSRDADSIATIRNMREELGSAISSREALESERDQKLILMKERMRDSKPAQVLTAPPASKAQDASSIPRSAPRFQEIKQPSVERLEVEIQTLETQISRKASEIARIEGKLERAELRPPFAGTVTNGEKSAEGSSNVTDLLLATGITRFGILILVVYLVQILLGLYKYNAQLSSHYYSQADALILLEQNPTTFSKFSKALAPNVSFGRPEDTLTEKIVDKLSDSIKGILDKRKTE